MQRVNSGAARWSAALPVAAVVMTAVLAGCNGKNDADTTTPANPSTPPATSTVPPGPNATGASTPGLNPAGTPGAAPGGPGGTMMNKPSMNPAGAPGDALITAKVKSTLIADTKVGAADINVNTKSGTVVLQGKQATAAAKAQAIADTKKIEGVKNVIDHLSVKP